MGNAEFEGSYQDECRGHQSWAEWKGLESEDTLPANVPHNPLVKAVVYFSNCVSEHSYASGADFPKDIPFGD